MSLTPISLAIASLLTIVVISYRQTIKAYPNGGGAFIVANDNIGLAAGAVAASALLTDYTLTVAVSMAAGVAAVTSALPDLLPYRVPMAIGFVALVTIANLRGAKESSNLFALPTYAFVTTVFTMLVIGFIECADGDCPQAVSVDSRHRAGSGRLSALDTAGLCLGIDRSDRSRSRSRRRPGFPSAQGQERGSDPDDHGCHFGHDVPRDFDPGSVVSGPDLRRDGRHLWNRHLPDWPGGVQRRRRISGCSRCSPPGSSSWPPTLLIRTFPASRPSSLDTS